MKMKIIMLTLLVTCAASYARFIPKEDAEKYEKQSLELIASNDIDSLDKACATIEALDLNTESIRNKLYQIALYDTRPGVKLKDDRLCVPRYRAATALGKIMGFRHNGAAVEIQSDEMLKSIKDWLSKQPGLKSPEELSPSAP